MGPEAVQIMALPHRCLARWERATGRLGPWAAYVEVGTLDADGRWYVWVVGQASDNLARLYPDEASAREVAARWRDRIGGRWTQVPCHPTQGWQPGEQPDQLPDSGST